MLLRIVRRTSCQVTDWAGGRTVQLDIYPPEAEYKKRDFKYRLSTATCTQEGESPFTALPGIHRYLMILDGELYVRHEGHHDMTLHPYREVDSFEGGWSTFSTGIVRDFNLMLAEGWTGGLCVIQESGEIPIQMENSCVAFFCGQGKADICLSTGAVIALGPEDMAVVEDILTEGTIKLLLHDGAKVIRADMRGN